MIIMIIIMMIMKFVNRKRELEILKKRITSGSFELIIILGRRRIGKTRLILESLRRHEYIYYLAVEGSNIRYFKTAASRLVPEVRYAMEEWESIFAFLKDRIIVIDEFPNLIKEDPRIISIFQRIIDTQLQGTRTKLILCGSSISMMKDRVLSHKSPLYGRRTSTLRLRPLRFPDIRGFFPSSSWEELVEIYGFADGLPYYLKRVETPFWSWLGRELKSPDTFLKEEIDFLLKYEFTDPSTYRRILEAIAHGKNTPKEIREYTGLGHADLTPYLRNLMDVELVVREVPITEKWSSKRGRYFLSDNFLNFWFRFVGPNLSLIEEGLFDIDAIKRDYSHYLGPIFEKVAREVVLELIRRGKLDMKVTRLGKWWWRGEEIDLVLVDDQGKRALLVEAKWSDLSSRSLRRIIKELIRKGELLLEGYDKEYLVIERRAEEVDGAMVLDLRSFDEIFGSPNVSESAI